MNKFSIGLFIITSCFWAACTQSINLDVVQCEQPMVTNTILSTSAGYLTILNDSLSGNTINFIVASKQNYHRKNFNSQATCNCLDSVVNILVNSYNDTILLHIVKKYLPNKILQDEFACSVKWHTEAEFHTSTEPKPFDFSTNFGQTFKSLIWQIPNSQVSSIVFSNGTNFQFAELKQIKVNSYNYKNFNFNSTIDMDTTIYNLPPCQ